MKSKTTTHIYLLMTATFLTMVLALPAAAQQVKMVFSGTGGPSTVNLQLPNTVTSEEIITGNGTLGPFTFRDIRASEASPQPSSTCSGTNQLYFPSVVGAGVFSFQDASLLKVNLTQGGDCIDFINLEAHCTFTFSNHSWRNRPFQACFRRPYVDRDRQAGVGRRLSQPCLLADAGEFTGTVSGVATEADRQEERQ